jgi:DegV family protein with EDD domain
MSTHNTVALIADSTCDLSPELVQKHQIGIVPLYIVWDTDSYKDGIELDAPTFYKRLVSSDEQHQQHLIKTSQPSPEDFVEAYQRARDEQQADEVVCITLSQKLSGTFNSAEKAAKMVNFPVRVVDSTSVSHGLTVLSAVEARTRGASAEEIANVAAAVGKKSQIFVVLNTLDYVYRGGRISGTQRMLGTMLSIKPILSIFNGEVTIADRVRTHKRAMTRLLELARCVDATPGALRVAVMDGGVAAEADEFAAEVKAALQPAEMIRGVLSPVLGVHGGPGLIGIIVIPVNLT